MNLLIVNDEKITADTLKERISWENYGICNVYTAYDVEEAKNCIGEYDIAVMLCDIEMPGDNGLSLLRWIREKKKDIECIFLTCHAKFDYALEAMNLGCQDYILLPEKYENIGETVLKVVKRIGEKQQSLFYREYGEHMMMDVLQTKDEELGLRSKISRKDLVKNVTSFIIQNLSDFDLSVEMLGEQFHFHPVYINRMFKEEKGIAISKFIVNERMKLAVVIMEKGEYNALEIARKVGYRQYSNFYTMFKKYYGFSPAKYREKYIK